MRLSPARSARGAAVAALLTAVSAAGWSAATDPATIPGVASASEGNSNTGYPFSGDPIRYQQVISSSEFPGGPRWITRLAFRPDSATGGAFQRTLPEVTIKLSTSPLGPGNLKKTFADNVGADVKTVFSGRLTLSSAFTGPDNGPKDFDIIVPLQTPFYYDPAAGSLLLEIVNGSGGRTTQLDAHDAPDSTARIWSDDPDAASSTRNDPYPSAGLVIRFFSD